MSGIKVGDTFNAFVKKGINSKRLDGEEGAGQLAMFCPAVATKIYGKIVETEHMYYNTNDFEFEVI